MKEKSFYAYVAGRYINNAGHISDTVTIFDVEEQGRYSISGTESTKIGKTLSQADNDSHGVFVIGDWCGSFVTFVRHDTPSEPAFSDTVYRGPSSRTKGNKANKTRVGRDKSHGGPVCSFTKHLIFELVQQQRGAVSFVTQRRIRVETDCSFSLTTSSRIRYARHRPLLKHFTLE